MLVSEAWIEGFYEGGYEVEFDGFDRRESEGECEGGQRRQTHLKRGERNKELGRRGEEAVARYLSHIGYEIIERNWSCPVGEADIIARTESALVFVEVKTRTDINKGFPAEAVTPEKRDRYERIALWYLKDCDELDVSVRFDVVAVMVLGEDRAMLKHYVNAFGWER